MHIGLIGGIGPAATEFYYRGLIDQYAQANAVLDLTIVHADVREMARNLANGDAPKQAAAFAVLLRRLSAAGAELAAVTSMGGHFCIADLEAISPLPLLNAIPLVAAEIRRRGIKTVGILGTSMVMQTGLYGAISSATVVVPDGAALAEVHRNYAEMATVGRVSGAQRQAFFDAGKALHHDRGAEVILLGGTDLFLAFQGVDCGFPVLDCAQIHIDALCQRSLGG
jgi:aspartate racemase